MHSLDDANLMCIAVATNKLVITNKLVKTITQRFLCFSVIGTWVYDSVNIKMASKQYFLTSSKQTVVANESIFTSEIHSNSAFQVFQDMRAKEELCDTYLCVGSQSFPAHRVVLAGTCPLFREKLATSQDEIESTAQRNSELEIPENFSKSVVLNVLDFLYEGKLVLNMNQMSELLQLLSFLKVRLSLV